MGQKMRVTEPWLTRETDRGLISENKVRTISLIYPSRGRARAASQHLFLYPDEAHGVKDGFTKCTSSWLSAPRDQMDCQLCSSKALKTGKISEWEWTGNTSGGKRQSKQETPSVSLSAIPTFPAKLCTGIYDEQIITRTTKPGSRTIGWVQGNEQKNLPNWKKIRKNSGRR